MKLFSTNNKNHIVDLKEAVLNALPPDNGLYLPCSIPKLSNSFFSRLKEMNFNELAFEISKELIGDSIDDSVLLEIVNKAFAFAAPLVHLNNNTHALELFHGPSLSFKDFGACFMAQLISHFNIDQNKKLTILVATSGDTGAAMASGFFNTEGIEVIILYPSGKVSPFQEKQITGFGQNIKAIEINGSFDDCQHLVKRAFLDDDLDHYRFTSANSINIARIIAQTFYYFRAYSQLDSDHPVVFSVPSGNLGNITAGYISYLMGLPVHRFIAATNSNKVVPEYINTGNFMPQETISTISNAMDVGNPSNFARLLNLSGSTWNNFKAMILGHYLSDRATLESIIACYDKYGYVIDPHSAIAFNALQELDSINNDINHIFLSTAHPLKYSSIIKTVLKKEVKIPPRVSNIQFQAKHTVNMNNDYNEFKSWLLNRY